MSRNENDHVPNDPMESVTACELRGDEEDVVPVNDSIQQGDVDADIVGTTDIGNSSPAVPEVKDECIGGQVVWELRMSVKHMNLNEQKLLACLIEKKAISVAEAIKILVKNESEMGTATPRPVRVSVSPYASAFGKGMDIGTDTDRGRDCGSGSASGSACTSAIEVAAASASASASLSVRASGRTTPSPSALVGCSKGLQVDEEVTAQRNSVSGIDNESLEEYSRRKAIEKRSYSQQKQKRAEARMLRNVGVQKVSTFRLTQMKKRKSMWASWSDRNRSKKNQAMKDSAEPVETTDVVEPPEARVPATSNTNYLCNDDVCDDVFQGDGTTDTQQLTVEEDVILAEAISKMNVAGRRKLRVGKVDSKYDGSHVVLLYGWKGYLHRTDRQMMGEKAWFANSLLKNRFLKDKVDGLFFDVRQKLLRSTTKFSNLDEVNEGLETLKKMKIIGYGYLPGKYGQRIWFGPIALFGDVKIRATYMSQMRQILSDDSDFQ